MLISAPSMLLVWKEKVQAAKARLESKDFFVSVQFNAFIQGAIGNGEAGEISETAS